MALRDTSIIWKVNICLQMLGVIFNLAGFGSDYIVSYERGKIAIHLGLWHVCHSNWDPECFNAVTFLDGTKESAAWLKASRGLMCMSLVAESFVIVLTFALGVSFNKLTAIATAVIAFFAAGVGVIGMGVATGEGKSIANDRFKVTTSIAWSFILFMIGQLINIVSGLMHLLDAFIIDRSGITSVVPSPIAAIS